MPDVKHPVGPSQLVQRATEQLEELMAEQNVSANRLSKLSGVQDSTVGRILKGQMIPSLDVMDRLFAGLGYEVGLEVIFNGNFAHEAALRGGHQRSPGRPVRTERSNIGSS